MKKIILLLFLVTIQANSQTNFTGAFDVANWTMSNSNTDGFVNTSGAPNIIQLTSGSMGNIGEGNTDFTIFCPTATTISFNWSYNTSDMHPQFDYPRVSINGVITIFTGFDYLDGQHFQQGSTTVNVPAGNFFGLNMHTTDNMYGRGTVTISNFNFVATTAEPTPTITAAPTASSICLGNTLASSSLIGGAASVAGTFAFITPSTAPGSGTASQVYLFTPTDSANYRIVAGLVSVTVNPVLTPTFTQVNPICFGGTLSALPTTSTNSIAGNWSPSINSAATTTYTFTPSDQCSFSTTMTIVVNRSLAGTASANQIIAWGAQPDDITLTNSVGAVQWQSSTNNSLFTNIAGAPNSPTLDGAFIGALTADKYFRAIVNDAGCGNVTSATVSVTTTTKIKDTYCGSTLPTINAQIQAEIFPSAQLYRYHVSKNGTVLGTYEVNKNNFDLTKIVGSAYVTTYAIKVAVKINDVWGNYGTSCNVTTPTIVSSSSVPLTKLRASQCGSTLAGIGSPIHSELVYAAEAYRFELTNGTTVTEVESPIYYFFLTNTAIGSYGTTFSVKTKAKINGVWGNYGTACAISTPALLVNTVPLTQVSSSFCNTTLAASNTKISALTVYNAEGYRFEITSNGTTVEYNSPAYNFRLSQTGIAVASGTAYSIRVAAKVNGVYGNYGVACTVTTPGNASNSKAIIENTDFSLVAYPNPSNSDFKLQFTGANEDAVSILVFDMTGRQIENKEVNASDVENITIGQNYSTGIYNIIVSQGINTKTGRLVKN
jgi:hypothetical protein